MLNPDEAKTIQRILDTQDLVAAPKDSPRKFHAMHASLTIAWFGLLLIAIVAFTRSMPTRSAFAAHDRSCD